MSEGSIPVRLPGEGKMSSTGANAQGSDLIRRRFQSAARAFAVGAIAAGIGVILVAISFLPSMPEVLGLAGAGLLAAGLTTVALSLLRGETLIRGL